MGDKTRTARQAALDLLCKVTSRGKLLPELLPKGVADLPPSDRARAQRLATETLRWADRADRLLGSYLRNKPEDVVLNALRMGVMEMAIDGADPHGVVNETVNLVKHSQSQSKAGLANAVLRKIPDVIEKWDTLPYPKLPKWLFKQLRASYSKQDLAAIEQAHAAGAPLDITVKSDPVGWAQKLDGDVLPTGSIRLKSAKQVTNLPGFSDGAWWVQDAAAAIPALILNAQPGEKVLDLCAAPGGKTMQMANSGARITALDVSETRQERVRENLLRTNLPADVVVADAFEWNPPGLFDAILIDAPCSATGTIRRHPDLPYAKTIEDIEPLFDIQTRMIASALNMLKPGGRMVYCTCSLFPEEGEHQIERALNQYASLTLDPEALKIDGVDQNWVTPFGLRLRPDYWAEIGGMDGFFIAALQKAA